jgi:hypothetical protein
MKSRRRGIVAARSRKGLNSRGFVDRAETAIFTFSTGAPQTFRGIVALQHFTYHTVSTSSADFLITCRAPDTTTTVKILY